MLLGQRNSIACSAASPPSTEFRSAIQLAAPDSRQAGAKEPAANSTSRPARAGQGEQAGQEEPAATADPSYTPGRPITPEESAHRNRLTGTSVKAIASDWSGRWKTEFRQGISSRFAERVDPTTKREQRMYITPATVSRTDLRPGDEVTQIRCVVGGKGLDVYGLAFLKACLGSALSGADRTALERWLDSYSATKPAALTAAKHTFPTVWFDIRVGRQLVEAGILAR